MQIQQKYLNSTAPSYYHDKLKESSDSVEKVHRCSNNKL